MSGLRLVRSATSTWGGSRTGQACVKKVFNDEYERYEDDFFNRDMEIVDKVLRIISQFNSADIIPEVVRLNVPDIWTDPYSGQRMLVEPFIDNYRKFISNTGWIPTLRRDCWAQVMQALSHFSYHISSGQFTICDLQGGVNTHGAIITDPAVHSQSRRFGVTDLGREGIVTFFTHHRCTRFCRDSWVRPKTTGEYYRRQKGTMMVSRGFRGRRIRRRG